MRTRTVFLAGLVLGLAVGAAFLEVGALVLIPGIVTLAWAGSKGSSLAGASGWLIGFGVGWLTMLGQASLGCANDPSCSQPDVMPWVVLGVVVAGAGLIVGLAGRSRVDTRL